MTDNVLPRTAIVSAVASALDAQSIIDLHTHLYTPAFGTPVPNATGKTDPRGLMLWGVDELVTYHYLVAEVYRVVPATKLPYEQFWKMSKTQQADHIWKWLFVERTPVSEACRGVITTLSKLGLDPTVTSLDKLRPYFASQTPSGYIDRVMELSHVSSITMTNAPFDDNERNRWLANPQAGSDGRFAGVLRIDPMLRDWPAAAKAMAGWGYKVDEQIGGSTIEEAKRFLRDWIDKVKAIYLAVSLPPEFRYPAVGDHGRDAHATTADHGRDAHATARAGQTMIEKVVLPVCAEKGLPFAMMIGATLRVNPALGDAGDMVGKSDVPSVVNLCRSFPANKFLVTMLARENQHELCVAARKFGNLMPFGCWWFLNNPSLIEELTRMRMELLGTSFIPQHSDARVLDQLIYKWEHSRKIIAKVLASKYEDLNDAGRPVSKIEIERDVKLMLRGNFEEFVGR